MDKILETGINIKLKSKLRYYTLDE